jgi:hypothetical protein
LRPHRRFIRVAEKILIRGLEIRTAGGTKAEKCELSVGKTASAAQRAA